MIAPTCATASVRIVGGSTGDPSLECDRYRSLRDTFLMPTIRLSTSYSVIRSTRRNGYRCGRIRSIVAWSKGSVKSICGGPIILLGFHDHADELRGAAHHAVCARARSDLRPRPRRTAPQDSRAHRAAHEVPG